MTPAEPFLSAVDEPADSGAVDAASQPKQPKRGQRAARKPPKLAEKPRPEDKSALLVWAYAEYQDLRQQGQTPDIDQWCARFPTCRSALRQVLQVEAFTASYLKRRSPSIHERRRPSSGDESIAWPSEGEERVDFTILRELARGAIARVYLATEASTGGRLVVLKCSSLLGDAEARTLGRLAHPHIVPILSARLDKPSGLTLVCMPYLGSATLEDVLDRLAAAEAPPSQASFFLDVIRFRAQPEDPSLPPDPCLLHGSYTDGVIHLAGQLAETLAFLHHNGVCHRDLKPSNVLLDPSGKPLLLDFNLSESEREAAVPVGGTLRYMAPEQIRAFLAPPTPPSPTRGEGEKGPLPPRKASISARVATRGEGEKGHLPPRKASISARVATRGEGEKGPLPPCGGGRGGGGHGMDERVDFYALGVMVYDLLGGAHPGESLLARPFRTSQAQEMLVELNAGFQPFRKICPELERPVAAALDRCVALDASDRPSSAAELAAALKRQFTPARRLRRWCVAQRRWLLATLGLLLLAVAVLAYAWAVTPPYSQRQYDRGRIAYYAGDFDKAQTHFDSALRAEPNNVRFRHARGCALLQQSKYLPPDQARFDQVLDDLTFTKSGAPDMVTLAVHAYMDLRRGRDDAAIKKYNRIQRSGYRPLMVLNNRAYGYMKKSQWEKAQVDLDRAVQLGPRCQAVHYNRAMVAKQMRSLGKTQTIPSQAVEDMEQALQLGPKTSALYGDAAIFYAQAAGDDPHHSYLERALFYLRQAVEAGEPPIHFHASPSLTEALKRPEFELLLDPHPPQAAPQLDLRLIDPLDLPD